MVRAMAQHFNFETNFVQPGDQSWGSIDSKGRWTGLVGQAGKIQAFHPIWGGGWWRSAHGHSKHKLDFWGEMRSLLEYNFLYPSPLVDYYLLYYNSRLW
jgi:hypothetical protein